MTIDPPEQNRMKDLIVAIAVTGDSKILTRTHFGSAEAYALYRCNHEQCKPDGVINNTTGEERHEGDQKKAVSVRALMSQHNVSIVVARRFGPNIKRIRNFLVPVIALSEGLDDTLHDVTLLWERIIQQFSMPPEQRWHVVLNKDRTETTKGSQMSAKVNAPECMGCTLCVNMCPVDAIEMQNGVAVIDEEGCVSCGACVTACPAEAISLTE